MIAGVVQPNPSRDVTQALVREAQAGSEEATELLLNQYRSVVQRLMRRFFLPGQERSDLEQEGMIGLVRAVQCYRPERDDSFDNHVVRCVRNHLIAAVRRATRKRHQILNHADSLDTHCVSGETVSVDPRALEGGPEEVVLSRMTLSRVSRIVNQVLPETERNALLANLLGFSHEEIRRAMGVTPKKLENLLYRARTRVRTVECATREEPRHGSYDSSAALRRTGGPRDSFHAFLTVLTASEVAGSLPCSA